MKVHSLLFFLLIVLFISCGVSEKDFIGKWKVTKFVTNITILSPQLLKDAEEMALSTVIDFRSDNTGTYTDNYSSFEFDWKFDNKKNTLEINGKGDAGKQAHTVTTISGDQMVLEMDLNRLGKQSMYLKRMD